MCLATVYVDRSGHREEVMDDVAWIEPDSHGLLLIDFLGERRLLQASIRSIDLLNSSIVLEGAAEDGGEAGGQRLTPPLSSMRVAGGCRGGMDRGKWSEEEGADLHVESEHSETPAHEGKPVKGKMLSFGKEASR